MDWENLHYFSVFAQQKSLSAAARVLNVDHATVGRRIRARQGGCAVGEAVITMAGNLAARYVIHTVGPRWQDGLHKEPDLLAKAYASCFGLINKYAIQSVAFPNISTGIYRFPKQLAAEIAIAEIKQALQANLVLQQVTVVCFEQDSYHIYQQLLMP